VSEDPGIEPRTVAMFSSAARRSIITRLDFIYAQMTTFALFSMYRRGGGVSNSLEGWMFFVGRLKGACVKLQWRSGFHLVTEDKVIIDCSFS
jgi:hypothetical protein